jgi:hypothetical protein
MGPGMRKMSRSEVLRMLRETFMPTIKIVMWEFLAVVGLINIER